MIRDGERLLGEPASVSVRRGRRVLGFALGALFLVVACSASDTAPAAAFQASRGQLGSERPHADRR